MFVSKFIDKLRKTEIIQNIEPFGKFQYFEDKKYWLCFSKNNHTKLDLEIAFEVEDISQDLSEKALITKDFLQDIEILEKHIYARIAGNIESKSIEQVKNLWFISGIYLENDNKTWNVVFEPNFDIETIYNHFLRFTVVAKEVVWSNIERNKKL